MSDLKRHFAAHDKAKANLDTATRQLRQSVQIYARANSMATPRPETLRAQLGL